MRFTKQAIDRLPIPEAMPGNKSRQVFYRDEGLLCFALRVTSSGTKSFIVEKRVNGRTRRITLGRYGDELTLEQARKQAHKLLGEIATGSDPVEEKRKNRAQSVTLSEVFEEYLTTRKDLKPRTVNDYRKHMAVIFHDWQNRPLATITKDMVAKRHGDAGERSKARANGAMRVLRALFNFAAGKYEDDNGRSLFPENPVKRLSKTRAWYRIPRKQTYIKPTDLAAWIEAVMRLPDVPDRDPGEGREIPRLRQGAIARDYLLLVLLTGLRRSEALELDWQSVDLKARTLTVRDTKNHEPHTLPLSDYLCDLLTRRKAESESGLVFSSADGVPFSNLRFALSRVIKQSGVRFSIHDLRRTFITIAESLDISAYALKRLLNHKMNNDVTAGYIIADVERLRKPMQAITDYILSAANVRPKAAIVEFKNDRASG